LFAQTSRNGITSFALRGAPCGIQPSRRAVQAAFGRLLLDGADHANAAAPKRAADLRGTGDAGEVHTETRRQEFDAHHTAVSRKVEDPGAVEQCLPVHVASAQFDVRRVSLPVDFDFHDSPGRSGPDADHRTVDEIDDHLDDLSIIQAGSKFTILHLGWANVIRVRVDLGDDRDGDVSTPRSRAGMPRQTERLHALGSIAPTTYRALSCAGGT